MTDDNADPTHAPEPQVSDPEKEVRELLASGQGLYKESKFKEALAKFDAAVKLDPRSAEAHKWRGDALYELYEYADAVAAYDKAVSGESHRTKADTRADAYYQRGEVLYSLRRFEDAAESYRKAVSLFDALADSFNHAEGKGYTARSGDAHNSLGYTLFALKSYDLAKAQFDEAILKGMKYPYAYHNIASVFWAQGRYVEAREYWEVAYGHYDEEARKREAERKNWPGHFLNFGNMLHEVYGELDYAEEMYCKARDMQADSVLARAGLLNIYIEKAACAKHRADSYRKAKRAYEEAKKILLDRLDRPGVKDLDSMIALGELSLAWNDYDGSGRWRKEEGKLAEKWLNKARAKDEEDGDRIKGYTRTAKPLANLGVLHARRKEYKKAIDLFGQALVIENDDLTLRSNLAEAYLRDKQLDEAEREYRYVIGVAPEHVESLIGLGEVCLARADAGEADMYEQAVTMFGSAVRFAQQRMGSKRLKDKELAKVLYLRAYARVKTFEGSKLWKDQRPLFFARDDFKLCFKADPELYLAQRAVDKIENNLSAHSPQRWLEKVGPFLVLAAALGVFGAAQWCFFFKEPAKLSGDQYIFATFAAMLLMVASLYLPQVLKLKFAGLELEKGTVDQLATLGTLGITKGV